MDRYDGTSEFEVQTSQVKRTVLRKWTIVDGKPELKISTLRSKCGASWHVILEQSSHMVSQVKDLMIFEWLNKKFLACQIMSAWPWVKV